MTILIDRPLWPARGRVWSHMVSDTSFEELHAFASRLGVPGRAFERDHYDVPEELYGTAVQLGAEPVGCQELLSRLTGAGLRRRKTSRVSRPDQRVSTAGTAVPAGRADPSRCRGGAATVTRRGA